MGWFDEKVSRRLKYDDASLEDSFLEIAGAVMGKRMSDALNDERQKTKDAIDDILKFYKAKSREVPESIKDMNEVLEYLMRPYGIMRRNVELEAGWPKDAAGAMLGVRTDTGNVVALIPDRFSGYVFYDEKTGKRRKIRKEDEKLIDKEALAFYKPFPLTSMGITSLLKYIWDNITISDLVLYAATALVIALIGTLSPRLNKILFSDVITTGSMQMLMGITIFMICIMLSQAVFGAVQSLFMARISTKLNINVEAATMMRILSLPVSFFNRYSSGELSKRSQYIGVLVKQLFSMAVSTGLSSLFSLIYIAQIFEYAPSLVIPSVLVTVATVTLSVITSLLQMGITKRKMELASKENGMCYAMISGIQKIKITGSEKRAFARWGKLYAEEARLTYNPPAFIRINQVITTAISLAGTIVIYIVAIKEGVTVSEYYAFNSAYGMVSGAFTSLAGIAVQVAQIRPILEMARQILQEVPEIAEEKEVVEEMRGGVELSNISFRYNENMPLVLENLSLRINPGQYVAIVGKTGCGKSTLVRILLGFEKPQKGAVYYDGKDIEKLDLKSLRRKIGTVMQNGKLLSGNIYSNIVISAPQLTLSDAWEAAELAGIAEDIRRMPMGMHTYISEGHGGISGGQRQRLMIARAIAPKPRILIFDEATSALDNITQKHVSESLDSLDCTRIVIAHRLSTIKNCNRIIVMDGGRIIEDGTYDELIKKEGYFAELVERQKLETEGHGGAVNGNTGS
ncbi:MAG: NHLP bacteriocin export ABC transporter permease/ATPase subunit [Butyrivibrio sp.]|nr:NHLP bacteriocin export ABC transporter permease/ATPase subunit [Butyrivibrio sp.]